MVEDRHQPSWGERRLESSGHVGHADGGAKMGRTLGVKDGQTVAPGGARIGPVGIEGVVVHELGNVMTRSGFMTEIFRTDWAPVNVAVAQVNWAELSPG